MTPDGRLLFCSVCCRRLTSDGGCASNITQTAVPLFSIRWGLRIRHHADVPLPLFLFLLWIFRRCVARSLCVCVCSLSLSLVSTVFVTCWMFLPATTSLRVGCLKPDSRTLCLLDSWAATHREGSSPAPRSVCGSVAHIARYDRAGVLIAGWLYMIGLRPICHCDKVAD